MGSWRAHTAGLLKQLPPVGPRRRRGLGQPNLLGLARDGPITIRLDMDWRLPPGKKAGPNSFKEKKILDVPPAPAHGSLRLLFFSLVEVEQITVSRQQQQGKSYRSVGFRYSRASFLTGGTRSICVHSRKAASKGSDDILCHLFFFRESQSTTKTPTTRTHTHTL